MVFSETPAGLFPVMSVNENTGPQRVLGNAHFWPSGTLDVELEAVPVNGRLRIT